MSVRFLLGMLMLVILMPTAAQAEYHINGDRGGRIGTYVDKYQSVRDSGEPVVIDGLCASACTIVLAAVPRDRICVTANANLGFHAAWDFGEGGRPVTNPAATQMLYAMYPRKVRKWIAARGGLRPKMVFARGKSLAALGYKSCRANAYANATPY